MTGQEAYSLFLKSDFWREISQKCKDAANRLCQDCKSRKKLQAHHTSYPDNWYETTLEQLRCLCEWCHKKAHGFEVGPDPRTRKRGKRRQRRQFVPITQTPRIYLKWLPDGATLRFSSPVNSHQRRQIEHHWKAFYQKANKFHRQFGNGPYTQKQFSIIQEALDDMLSALRRTDGVAVDFKASGDWAGKVTFIDPEMFPGKSRTVTKVEYARLHPKWITPPHVTSGFVWKTVAPVAPADQGSCNIPHEASPMGDAKVKRAEGIGTPALHC